MDTQIKYTKDGKNYNQFHEEIIECGLCSGPTTMRGTKRCDWCWELENSVARNPKLARKILDGLEDTEIPIGHQLDTRFLALHCKLIDRARMFHVEHGVPMSVALDFVTDALDLFEKETAERRSAKR